jgi:hypothetical protein
MIVEILFVVAMFIWLLTILPVPQVAPFTWSSPWLAFICVLLLGIFIFVPGLR